MWQPLQDVGFTFLMMPIGTWLADLLWVLLEVHANLRVRVGAGADDLWTTDDFTLVRNNPEDCIQPCIYL